MKKQFIFFIALFCASSIFASDTQVNGIWYDFDFSTKTASVTYRGSHVFLYENEYTGSVVIPQTVTYNETTYSVTMIGEGAFFECTSLTSITISNSVTTIGNSAFSGCSGLTSINVDATNTHYCSIDGVLFNYAEDTLIQYPIGNTRTEYSIPNSVTTIGGAAFSSCHGLTAITIPHSVTTIERQAFFDCSGLTSIYVDIANKHYCSIDGVLFNYAKDTLILHPAGNIRTEYTIPNSVTSIGDEAFFYCSGLTSITIPNSVTLIGKRAFNYCSGLTSITIPNSVTTIGDWAFRECSNLTSVTIPNSVTTIGRQAFAYCSGLTSVTIGNSVTAIGSWTFNDCPSLTFVILLNTNVKIGEYAFNGCTITNLYCGIDVDLSNASGKVKNIHRLNEEELQYVLPFNQYVIGFVEPRINEWQKKGEFEKTIDWQKRVTDATRKQKTDSLVLLAKKNYLAHYQINNNPTFTLGTYDADNEVYPVQSSSGEDLLVVAIPISEAPYVKQNWSSCIVTPHYGFAETDVVLLSIDFTFPNKKTYTYRLTDAKKAAQTISKH